MEDVQKIRIVRHLFGAADPQAGERQVLRIGRFNAMRIADHGEIPERHAFSAVQPDPGAGLAAADKHGAIPIDRDAVGCNFDAFIERVGPAFQLGVPIPDHEREYTIAAMYKDDFIMRHVRLFVMAIARVLGLIKEGDLGFALETVRVAFQDLLGMSLDDFLAYPEERLRDFLYFGELEVMGLNRTAFAASMLLHAGRIFRAQENEERARACFERALQLLVETTLSAEDEVEMPDFTPPVQELLDEVRLEDLSDSLLTQLAFFFERNRDLKRADAAIQTLIARRPDDPDVRDLARSFYDILLDEDEAELGAAGFSEATIRERMKGLKS